MDNILKNLFLILFTLVTLSPQINGQQIAADRPDQTDSPTIIPKKSFQIETGLLSGFSENNNISVRQLLLPTNLVRYGLSEKIEIRIIEQVERLKSQHPFYDHFGLSDILLGTKVQIFKKKDINAEIAFITYLIIPTGSRYLTNKNPGTSSKIAISHSITDFLDIGYNLGYDYLGLGKGDLTYSVSMGAAITKKIGFFAESYGEITEFKNFILNLDSGLSYLILDNFQVDLSFGVGLNQKMNFFSAGLSWNIARRHSI